MKTNSHYQFFVDITTSEASLIKGGKEAESGGGKNKKKGGGKDDPKPHH